MKSPKVSVIVPVYNVEKYVAQCLESILSQTCDDMEVIVVDDCGTDSSMAIVREIIGRYRGGKQVMVTGGEANGGLSAARNRGVSAARGEYLYFIDSDDYLCQAEAIAQMLERGTYTGADVVTANSIMFDDVTGHIYRVVDRDHVDGFYENVGAEPDVRLGGVAWNKLISREFLLEHDLWFDEGVVFEDTAWTFKLVCSSPRVATMSGKFYRYRYRAGSIMNTLTRRHILSRAMLPVLCARWLAQHPTTKKKFALLSLEDMKTGCHTALLRSGNGALLPAMAGIYRREIPQFNAGALTGKERLKTGLPRVLPQPLYLWMVRAKTAWKSRGKPKGGRVDLGADFMTEVRARIDAGTRSE